jgi:hypothetical protein
MPKPAYQRKRPRLGDIVEINVPGKGLAYVQYVNEHRDPPVWGSLLRVLPGTFKTRPNNFRELAEGHELYFVFFPLGAACNRGYVKIVANERVPRYCRQWPILKAYNENIATGEKTWFLWDGNTSWRVGELPTQFYDASMKEVITLKALEDRIATGWMPRDEVPPGPPRGLRS